MGKDSDIAQLGKYIKCVSSKKHEDNTFTSTELLKEKGVQFESKNNGAHLIVGEYDLWPSTGLFIHRKTKKRGRGVFKLLRKVEAI